MKRADAVHLLRLTRPLLPPLVGSLMMRILGLLGGVVLLAVAARAVVAAAEGDSPTWRLAALLVALAAAKGVARYLEQYLGHLVAFRSLALLRVYFFRRLEPQAPAATEGRRTGDLMARVTRDIDRVEVFFAHTLVPGIAAVLVPVLVVAWVAGRDPVLAAVLAFGLVLVGGAAPLWGARGSGERALATRRRRGALAQEVTDTVQGVREVLAFDAGPARLARLDAAGEDLAADLRRAGEVVGRRRGVIATAVLATLIALTWIGAARVAAGTLTWSDLVTVLAVALGVFPAVTAVEEFMADLDQALASARRVFEVTEAVPATADPVHPHPLPTRPATGRTVSFRDVTFAYPGGREKARAAVEHLDLELAPGTTALVGASGAGKSTTAALLLRFWDPDAGQARHRPGAAAARRDRGAG